MIVIAVLFSGLWGAEALSADEKIEGKAVRADHEKPIHKGAKELALLTGFGMSHEIWDGVGDVRFIFLGAHLGRVLSAPSGPGFLRGHPEVSGEFMPFFILDQGETTHGASFTLLGRHFLAPGSTWRPYVVLGMGFLVTGEQVPVETGRVNFTPQAGMGVAYTGNRRFTFYVEYRLHHLSHGMEEGANPGINSSTLQFSGSILRW
jgi:hypothetical protein